MEKLFNLIADGISSTKSIMDEIKRLEDSGVNLETETLERRRLQTSTVLGWACAYNSPQVVRLLLEKGLGQNAVVQTYSSGTTLTALGVACAKDSDKIVSLLLEKSFDPNEVAITYANGTTITPLGMACFSNLDKVAKILLDKGTDPNVIAQKDRNGETLTALGVACYNNSDKVAQILLDKGLDPNAVVQTYPDGETVTAFGAACLNNSDKVVKLLLEKSFDPTLIACTTSNGTTISPLGLACDKNSGEVVTLLLEQGLDPNSVVIEYPDNVIVNAIPTALRHACRRQSYEVVEILLEKGARPEEVRQFLSDRPNIELEVRHRLRDTMLTFGTFSTDLSDDELSRKEELKQEYKEKVIDQMALLLNLEHSNSLQLEEMLCQKIISNVIGDRLVGTLLRDEPQDNSRMPICIGSVNHLFDEMGWDSALKTPCKNNIMAVDEAKEVVSEKDASDRGHKREYEEHSSASVKRTKLDSAAKEAQNSDDSNRGKKRKHEGTPSSSIDITQCNSASTIDFARAA